MFKKCSYRISDVQKNKQRWKPANSFPSFHAAATPFVTNFSLDFFNPIIEALKWTGDTKSCKKQSTSVQKLAKAKKQNKKYFMSFSDWTFLNLTSIFILDA